MLEKAAIGTRHIPFLLSVPKKRPAPGTSARVRREELELRVAVVERGGHAKGDTIREDEQRFFVRRSTREPSTDGGDVRVGHEAVRRQSHQ